MFNSKKTFKKIAIFLNSVGLFIFSALPAKAATSGWSGICVSTKDPDVATLQGFQCLLTRLLNSFLTLVGIAGFLMVVISGIRILMSGGNAQAMEKSKNSITYAVAGLILALSAFIILNLIAEFTGVKNILEFWVPDSSYNWPE